jgi:FAD-linked oxidoreductase
MSNKIWKNWAGNVACTPADIFHPRSEAELKALVDKARAENRKIRMVGTGHSFTPLAATDGYMATLQNLQGVIHINKEKKQATVWAGTTINALGKLLFEQGLGQLNLGDIDKQSIAGATSTGTHGTGVNFGGISTQIIGLRLLTASGEFIDCSAEQNPEVFAPARIGLGALGIVTQVTLQLGDAYKLDYRASKANFDDTLRNLEKYKQENRNFEFYWFPYTDTVQLKISNETNEPVQDGAFKKYINQNLLENKVFGLLCRFGRTFSGNYQRINRILGWAVGNEKRINYSHNIYASPRNVRFKEMEYNIPAEHFDTVLRQVKATIEAKKYKVFFPLECRWAKADDIWLSPAYGRDSAYIAFHVFEGTAHEDYFTDMEAICMQYGGRPHWGKMHTRHAQNLETAYPKWQDFLALRARLDPDNLFVNAHTAQLFGLEK